MTDAADTDTTLEWDSGTAYDFFASLLVLHNAERYGLRGSWAAGVRSRLVVPARECLQQVIGILRPLSGVYATPPPKDTATFLAGLRGMEPLERLATLVPGRSDEATDLLRGVAARGCWSDDDLIALLPLMQQGDWRNQTATAARKDAVELLDTWADAANRADSLLAALESYYDVFFREEEERILPALAAGLAHARRLAARLPQAALLEELSQGLRLAPDRAGTTLVLVPSFWLTPFVVVSDVGDGKKLYLFGARPANVSLVPGEFVPDALHQALKALSEPTRLRILRYLTEDPLTPADLARRLRLRAPTVIHHLDTLRLARLVSVILDASGKRYAARPEGTEAVFQLLKEFLEGQE